jgi:hypothetical protein
MNILFIINLASSLFLVGLIWTVQCVHYPIFHLLEKDSFTDHIHFHKRSISFIVVPVMTTELITSGWLAWAANSNIIMHQIGFTLVVFVWIITFFVQVPLHNQLSTSRSSAAITKLVKSNWLRTALWTMKGILSLIILTRLI